MAPSRNWRDEYPVGSAARIKLEYCDRTLARLRDVEPSVSATDLDEDVSELGYSLVDYYKNTAAENEPSPGLDGDLRAIFEDRGPAAASAATVELKPASDLIRRRERSLMADVFRWTGHFPEKTRAMMRHLAKRADDLQLKYSPKLEADLMSEVAVLVTSLAMNYVHRGSYFPEAQTPERDALAAKQAAERNNAADRPPIIPAAPANSAAPAP
jgi:hypothetical protein